MDTLRKFGLSILIFFVFLSTMLNAQVKIKERVEIAPVSLKVQNKSSSNSDSPDACSDIYFSAGGNPVRLITQDGIVYGNQGVASARVCGISEVGFQMGYMDIDPDAGDVEVPYNFRATHNGRDFINISGLIHAFFAIGWWGGSVSVYSCTPTISITYPSEDEIVYISERYQPVIILQEEHFPPSDVMNTPIITWDPSNIFNTQEFYDQIQDTMSITVTVTAENAHGKASDQRTFLLKKVDVDHFNVTITPDSIFTYDVARLSAIAMDKYGNETEIDGNIAISVSASPNENISYSNEVSYSDLRAGNVYLYSGEISVPAQDFIFTVSWNEASGTGKLVVTQPSCLVLSVSPKKISPGGKADIIIKQLDCFGNLKSYPSDQMFFIWMNTDQSFGKFRSGGTGEPDVSLHGTQPFEFIATSSMDVDSTVVVIEAWTAAGGMTNSIGIGKDTLRSSESVMFNKEAKANTIGDQQIDVKKNGLTLEIDRLQTQLTKVSTKKGNEKQQQILAKRIQQLRAQSAYETANTPAEKQTALANIKQTAKLASETAECKSTAEITITKDGNHPPVIERINYSPSRKYFQVMSKVTISAVVSDPDGDAVTVQYLPSATIDLNNLGPYEITVIATDEHGATTEKKDTIYCVWVFPSPSKDRVIDGGNKDFEVKILPEGICEGNFQWSWEPKNTPAGNLPPKKDFLPDKTHQKVTVNTAWWYASPDDPCGANLECTYKLTAKTVLGQDEFECSTEMVVYLPEKGGEVTPPKLTGTPNANLMLDANGNPIYRIDKNSFFDNVKRYQPSPTYNIPESSQFYTKTYVHEMKHIEQWKTGMLKDLFLVITFYERIKNKSAKTLNELATLVADTKNELFNSDKKSYYEKYDASEIEAYDAAGLIPPLYIYQRCNKTHFEHEQ